MIDVREEVERVSRKYFIPDSNLRNDYKYPFGITHKMLEEIHNSKDDKFGGVEHLTKYASQLLIDQGYIPHTLIYDGFDSTHEEQEGGFHIFHIICQDRRK